MEHSTIDEAGPAKQNVPTTSPTNRNLWLAFTEEAKADRLYLAYAMKAMEEGHPEVAEVFLEVSGAETAHALTHLRVLGEVGSTRANLQRVIEEEVRESSVMYPRMIRQAEAEGRPDAASSFRLAFEGESRHAQLFARASESLGRKRAPAAPEPVASAAPVASTEVQRPSAEVYADVEREKERVAGLRRIREVVFGAQDGLISTVAIAATVMAASQETMLAVIAGLGSAMAGTISMAAGTYLGSRAASQMEQGELELERMELLRHPEEEQAELIATYRHDGYSLEEAEALADRVMRDRDLALQVMAERELGISPDAPQDPRKDAAVMAAAYVVGGVVPLSAYVFIQGVAAVPASMAVTLVALAAVGVAKARTARRSVLLSALEVMGIGAASGLLGFLLGDLLPRLIGAR